MSPESRFLLPQAILRDHVEDQIGRTRLFRADGVGPEYFFADSVELVRGAAENSCDGLARFNSIADLEVGGEPDGVVDGVLGFGPAAAEDTHGVADRHRVDGGNVPYGSRHDIEPANGGGNEGFGVIANFRNAPQEYDETAE